MIYLKKKMVAVISFLTVLRMLTNAQTSCNRGVGRLVFEKLLDTELQAFDEDAYRERAAPLQVLEKCRELCLQDRTSQESLVRICASFDFVPGRRTTLFSGAGGGSIDFEESVCFLSREQGRPEGIGTLTTNKYHSHFNEICLSSSRVSTECPERAYVFERLEGFRYDQRDGQELFVKNRTDCEDRCLNEYGFVCRSATYDRQTQRCFLGRSTRRSNPDQFVPDSTSVYLENVCLDEARRCEGLPVFIKEANVEFSGPFGLEVVTATSEADCQRQCLQHRQIFCRSIQYDDRTHTCVLSDDDSYSQPNELRPVPGSTSTYADIMCININVAGTTSTPPIIGSFERIRNQRLSLADPGTEVSSRSLGECLEECLRQGPARCMSILYSARGRTCRLSQRSRNDVGARLEFDADFDYYEGILGGNLGDGEGNSTDIEVALHLDDPETGFSYRNLKPNKLDRGNGFGSQGSSSNVGSGTIANYPPVPAYGPQPGYPPSGSGMGGYPPPNYGQGPGLGQNPGIGQGPMMSGSNWNSGGGGGGGGGQWYNAQNQPPNAGGPGGPPPWAPGYSTGLYPVYIPNSGAYGGAGPGSYNAAPGPYNAAPGPYNAAPGPYNSAPGPYNGAPGPYNGAPGPYNAAPGPTGYAQQAQPPSPINAPPLPPLASAPTGTALHPPINNGPGTAFSSSNFYGSYAPGRGPLIPGGPTLYSGGGGSEEPFVLVGPRQRIRYFYVRRVATVNSLKDCQKECLTAKDFCRSFNFRNFFQENCELSDQDTTTLDLNNPSYFDRNSEFDYYEKRGRGGLGASFPSFQPPAYQQGAGYPLPSPSIIAAVPALPGGIPQLGPIPPGGGPPGLLPGLGPPGLGPGYAGGYPIGGYPFPGQLDVKQVCSEDGIEFSLTTPEGFFGRIYTYGYYDTCYFDGRGESVSVLKVSRPDGFPRCGTIGYADYFTNIVVVQFNDFVQTGRDRKYNLTCTLYGPGETVVTSGVLNTGTVPIPLESLPAQNILASNVLLRILYKGYPVQQIAVGDPLIFRLETRKAYNYGADIFATNVVAKDPYSGRVVQLIDQAGCPVDWYIFPNLDRGRDAEGLEAQFNAFKIPDSNFLVFEATVRTCRGPCQPVNCNSPGRFNVVSFGRKRRSIVSENGTTIEEEVEEQDDAVNATSANITFESDPEQVRELLQVYLTRADIPVNQPGAEIMDVCLSSSEYYGLVVAIGIMFIVLGIVAITSASCIRRYKLLHDKNKAADTTSPTMSVARLTTNPATPYFQTSRYMPDARFDDPSEPIYTDPSLFERSRSTRSTAPSNVRKIDDDDHLDDLH